MLHSTQDITTHLDSLCLLSVRVERLQIYSFHFTLLFNITCFLIDYLSFVPLRSFLLLSFIFIRFFKN
jgi:hypothetical protein